jgi:hypothetical protein
MVGDVVEGTNFQSSWKFPELDNSELPEDSPYHN